MTRHLLRDNGLSLVMTALFLAFLAGHAAAGYFVDCEERRDHGERELAFSEYLLSPHLAESVYENWESEFLQMASYVVLTAILYQRGSAESRPLPDEEPEENEAEKPERLSARFSWLYQHSLSLALFILFLLSWAMHAVSGVEVHNLRQMREGHPPISLAEYLVSAQFWFESLQNWQSEYLSVAVLIVLSIFLREQGSPESKEVTAPDRQTG
jgi:hypothetical protein